MIDQKVLDFAIENNMNVLLSGKHGVGKTAIIKSTFEKYGLSYIYRSAATMDPWVDFVGVPVRMQDEQGYYTDLALPRSMRDNKVNAIFIDEFNRGHTKTINAVMELLQFRTLNGRSFPNLKVVWAAINPIDDEDHKYQVEEFDPAVKDRFSFHIDVEYKPDKKYFLSKYGEEVGPIACTWWDKLSADMKKQVSPRRLDDAVSICLKNGDIRYVIPNNASALTLARLIKHGDPVIEFKNLYKDKDKNIDEIKNFFNNPNKANAVVEELKRNANIIDIEDLIQHCPPEQMLSLAVQRNRVAYFIIDELKKDIERNKSILESIASKQTAKIKRQINQAISDHQRKNRFSKIGDDHSILLSDINDILKNSRYLDKDNHIWYRLNLDFIPPALASRKTSGYEVYTAMTSCFSSSKVIKGFGSGYESSSFRFKKEASVEQDENNCLTFITEYLSDTKKRNITQYKRSLINKLHLTQPVVCFNKPYLPVISLALIDMITKTCQEMSITCNTDTKKAMTSIFVKSMISIKSYSIYDPNYKWPLKVDPSDTLSLGLSSSLVNIGYLTQNIIKDMLDNRNSYLGKII